ncbi:MAG TPA: glutaredoxin family protein [Candidatus Saccharimonadales bacterium]|nr:glutaredoxin family protein [Candidatus Saccharimonadales bacterium]
MPTIKIYTTSTCIYCRAEKQFFDAHGIKYEEVKADESQEKATELFKASGQYAVPFTIIKQDDGKVEAVLGFDKPKLETILGVH